MRSGHGGAAGSRICGVAAVARRARVRAGSTDIGFDTVTSISCHRTAAAKAGDGICACIQGSNRIGGSIKGWRINNCGTRRAGITRSNYHHNASSGLRFDGGLKAGNRTAFRRRATPRVSRNIGRLSGVALAATYRVRREEEFHALDIPGRCAVALVHVAATNPLCAGRHSDLIASAVIADRRANSVGAVEEIITREW